MHLFLTQEFSKRESRTDAGRLLRGEDFLNQNNEDIFVFEGRVNLCLGSTYALLYCIVYWRRKVFVSGKASNIL